ncbi:hypothetical protein RSSM_02702 [Rhodopirellula sallentina SM41]|uniref:Uncharacterized protein n=1 Tax=Rhodopirellula sallentina SM41 TaxID=1263870 RepID=M5U344_9BACT|nr:hypothetical protein RSSM_02702 [Rhodopirellula sallentina SM41]
MALQFGSSTADPRAVDFRAEVLPFQTGSHWSTDSVRVERLRPPTERQAIRGK